MKYQRLVSNTTPSDLQEWLGQELEDRGADSVYARSVLSLLQQDCIDFEPWECQHFRNQNLKVSHKYGRPENLYSTAKSKQHKCKTWNKQILLTFNCRCKRASCDYERKKKQAAVECLRSASDYIDDIEELIDEVCIRLQHLKSLKCEKDEIHLRNIENQKIIDSFFIPPSSPTDEIEKYFAAFPPLNDKLETADVKQHNIENAWCGVCVTKNNAKSLTYNKCDQPRIPYSPLKQPKSIYQSDEEVCVFNHEKQTFSHANLKNERKGFNYSSSANCQITKAQQTKLAKQIINYMKGSWKAMKSIMTKSISFPLEYLLLIEIDVHFINNTLLLHQNKNYASSKLSRVHDFNKIYFLVKTISQAYFLVSKFKMISNIKETQDLSHYFISFEKIFSKNYNNTYLNQETLLNLKIFDFEEIKNCAHPNNETFLSSKLSLWTQQNGSVTDYHKEGFLGALNLDLNNIVEEKFCLNAYKNDIGQELLKKVLFISKNTFAYPPHKAYSNMLSENLPQWIPSSKDVQNISIAEENKFEEYNTFMSRNKYNVHAQLYDNKFQTLKVSTYLVQQKPEDELWILYWGDNHNSIVHTWQKANTFEEIKNADLLQKSEFIVALSKEIKEDGDELLQELHSLTCICDDTAIIYDNMSNLPQNNVYSYDMYNVLQIDYNCCNKEKVLQHPVLNSQDFVDEIDINVDLSLKDASLNDIVESDHLEMLQWSTSPSQPVYFTNSLEASNSPDLSAFPDCENIGSIESDYYIEGGGWSFTSDSFLDDPSFVNPYERSCSLDDLDLGSAESEYSEFPYQKRVRCISETTEDTKQFLRKQSLTQYQKRLKQKLAPRKRPCSFFLQGACSRSYCKFSHDLSTTTCRFWKEGSCFKGSTCPFLHGYIEENDKDFCELDQLEEDQIIDHSYSLESEADFPSLSSSKTETIKEKSAPINIIQVKGRKT